MESIDQHDSRSQPPLPLLPSRLLGLTGDSTRSIASLSAAQTESTPSSPPAMLCSGSAVDHAGLPIAGHISLQSPGDSSIRVTDQANSPFAGYGTSYGYSPSDQSHICWSRSTSRPRSVAPSPRPHWIEPDGYRAGSMISVDLASQMSLSGPALLGYRWSVPETYESSRARTVAQSPNSHFEGFVSSESDYWDI